ncbi:MAG: cytidylate kinase-like family protein [Bacteroidales bacterium]|nr:cytidylate kinase-like family protein [Bacteroidales bacterium]
MNTEAPFVITISREVGSGGRTVGRILAEKLNVRYCDKQLLESLEKQFGLSASRIEKLKGEKKKWFADFIEKVSPVPTASALGLDPEYSREFRVEVTPEAIFKAESEILKGFAELGPCVIAGRSGFFVLKDHPNKLDVFISASMPNRIERVMRKQNLSRESAQSVIEGIDKARENYIQRFAGVSRYDSRNYDLCINADGHTEEELADLILAYIKSC